MKKFACSVTLILASMSLAFIAHAATTPAPTPAPIELSPTRGDVATTLTIDRDGNTILKGAKIVQIAGNNMFVKTSWGSAKINWVIVVSKDTTLSRRFGGVSTINEFSNDEYINVEGTMYGSGGDSLVIKAKSVKNWSKENEPGEFSGTIANFNPDKKSFVLIVSGAPNVTVTAPAALTIKKGSRAISFLELRNGDRVISTGGVFNVIDRTLAVDRMEIFQEQSIFVPKNFQGTLKSIAGTSLPTTAVVTIEGKDYTIYLTQQTVIMNKLKEKALLQRFLIGDTVRLYGSIRKINLDEIENIEVFRNIDL